MLEAVRIVWLLLAVAAAGQTGWQRRGNLVLFDSPSGAIEVEWLSPSTFRLQRCQTPPCPSREGKAGNVQFTVSEVSDGLEFHTRFLTMRVDRRSGTVAVRNRSGRTILEEQRPEGALYRFSAGQGERFAGLGARTSESLDLRGTTVVASRPLLLSTAGYGLYFAAPAEYTFDLGASRQDRIRVTAPFARRLEYFFYYGPSPKEILEEHVQVTGAIEPISPDQLELQFPSRLPKHATQVPAMPFSETLRFLQHAAMSGIVTPAVDIAKVQHPAALFFPLVTHPDPPRQAVTTRNRWIPYLLTYLDEAQGRGLPMLHPVAFQYPDDPASWSEVSAFFIGDELLIPTASRVRLPQGLWTDLCTNIRHRGRQVIEVTRPGECPLAHNGAIVPIDSGKHIELHYYPRLAGEFFLVEPGEARVTQMHAGPAGDYLRLEIWSRVARTYEWVVHHVSAIDRIECTGCLVEPSGARYDEILRNYHVFVQAPARWDIVLNVSLKEPL
jgi:alpha-glucosidase (family GH31 glycosyl hydrolase)